MQGYFVSVQTGLRMGLFTDEVLESFYNLVPFITPYKHLETVHWGAS